MWDNDSIAQLTATVSRSPTFCGTRPWTLRFTETCVEVVEHPTAADPYADPLTRDRLVSCGAAAATLELAMRHSGLDTELSLQPDPGRRRLVAQVQISGHRDPDEHEKAMFDAIGRRHSYRRPFGPAPIDPALRARLVAEHHHTGTVLPGTQVVTVDDDDDTTSLARLLSYGASTNQTWTRPPDVFTLARRLRVETVLLVLSADNARADHLRAGVALQRTWLAAITAGLVASAHTQALRLPEVHAALIEQLHLPGFPHVLLRLGYPAPVDRGAGGRQADEAMTEVR